MHSKMQQHGVKRDVAGGQVPAPAPSAPEGPPAPSAAWRLLKAAALVLMLVMSLVAVGKHRNWSMPHNALRMVHSKWATVEAASGGAATSGLWLPYSVKRRVVVFVISPDMLFVQYALQSMRGLRDAGGYDGDIVVATEEGKYADTLRYALDCGNQDYLDRDHKRLEVLDGCTTPRYGAQVVGFPKLNLTELSAFHKEHPFTRGDGRHIKKTFQWNKLRLFDPWFKETYDRVVYMDAGFNVGGDLSDLWTMDTKGTLVAPLDDPRLVWKLESQIETGCCPEVLADLKATAGDLQIDHFQTGVVVFDTELIKPDTLPTLLKLMVRWPIMLTNEQALMNVYFSAMLQQWIPLQSYSRDWSIYEYCADPEGRTPDERYVLLWKYKCR